MSAYLQEKYNYFNKNLHKHICLAYNTRFTQYLIIEYKDFKWL